MTTIAAPSNKEIAYAIFNSGENDLKSSKILYTHKLYAQSIYHLHQSLEKLIKSYLTLFGILSGHEKQMREFGHDPIKIFKKTLVAILKQNLVPLENLPEYKSLMNQLHEIQGVMSGNTESSYDQISDALKIVEAIEMSVLNKQVLEEIYKKTSSTVPKVKYFAKMNYLGHITYVIFSILALSFVLKGHEETSRYPSSLDSKFGVERYNSNLGIVRAFNKIYLILRKSYRFASKRSFGEY